MPDDYDVKPGEPGIPDIFTRLSIAMCPQDDGTRPVDPNWPFSDISFLSPAISFSQFPVLVGQPNQVFIYIKNFGTADAAGVWLETAYNVFIGNQPEAMVPIQNITLPMIPAGGDITAALQWSPADTDAIHGCFHARVFDTFSLLHFPSRCMEWSSFLNPQAGSRNSILVKIEQRERPVMVMFKTKNFLPGPSKDRVLVTRYNSRSRFRDLDERFPIPFVFSAEGHTPARPPEMPHSPAPGPSTATIAVLGDITPNRASLRPAGMAGRPFTSRGTMWPRENINPKFIHETFGFDTDLAIELPVARRGVSRGHFHLEAAIGRASIRSFQELNLAAGEERSLRLVIPPSEFPAPGSRKRFQVDYQMGSERPVQYFIYLYH